jgi:hypothetical protein
MDGMQDPSFHLKITTNLQLVGGKLEIEKSNCSSQQTTTPLKIDFSPGVTMEKKENLSL